MSELGAGRRSIPAAHARTRRELHSVLRRQLDGVDAWNRARAEATEPAAEHLSREQRLDAARNVEALQRAHAALVERTGLYLLGSGEPMQWLARPRAVLVLRNTWFRERLSTALLDRGVEVVAGLDNGADGLGVVIAEQPELLLVEDALPMLTGVQVVQGARRFAGETVAVAQVGHDDGIGPMLDAGARTACTRRVPPEEVAATLVSLVPA